MDFGIMSHMKKSRVHKLPQRRKLVDVVVAPNPKANAPMEVELDMDAVRATVARMENPSCDPDTAVAIIERKIAAGEVDRLYAELWGQYVKIAPEETNGDAFGFIEMEFLALRQIMDDEVPDFLPDLHEDILSAALSLKVKLRLPVTEEARPKKGHMTCALPTPLERKRNAAVTAIQLAILASASRARRIGSDSYGLWRDALEVVSLGQFAPDGSMPRESVRRLLDSLRAANRMLALDAQVASYVPAPSADAERGEADDVL